jgi:hypothetical protein
MKLAMKGALAGMVFAAALLTLISFFSNLQTASAKDRNSGRGVVSSDIDAAGLNGARVYYQLTPEEGGAIYQFSNGTYATKVPAEVVFNYFTGERDEQGGLVYAIFVKRPGFLGGPFTKDKVRFSSAREPGTIDTVQPGDLFN